MNNTRYAAWIMVVTVMAMQSMGYGQDEIDEIVCILVSLKDQVVLEQ